MTVKIHLATAMICFMGKCYPALVGDSTPVGQFSMIRRVTEQRGYGGDVLQFKKDSRGVFAIHRVFPYDSRRDRVHVLTHGSAQQRRFVSNGCVNIMPDVYQKLFDCCRHQPLIIEP